MPVPEVNVPEQPLNLSLLSFQLATATIYRNVLSRHAQQHLPLQHPLASAIIDWSCYVGMLNSICLFSFHFASVTVDQMCYLGTPSGICLFSFHSASATIGRICYLGTPSGICLFSFHSASGTIDRFTLSRHARQNLPLWQLESLVCELARVPPSAGICCLGTLNSICLFIFHFASANVDRICYLGTLNSICLFSFHSASATIGRICYISARPTASASLAFTLHLASVTDNWIMLSRHAR